ncbi:hypothetical protein AAC387_Pa12g2058 [Persea americana]
MYAERSSAGKDGDLEATEAKTDLERNKMLVDKMKLNVPNTESGPPVVINVKGDDGGFDNGEEFKLEKISRSPSRDYKIVYTLLNRRVHSVIDDITGQLARFDNAEAAQLAKEANPVPPGGLNEWTYDCKIPCEFHIDFDHQSGVGRFIQLGCGCKDGLGTVHCHCAEVWFRLKGNRRCEICVCIFVMVCLVLAFVLPWYLCKHNF